MRWMRVTLAATLLALFVLTVNVVVSEHRARTYATPPRTDMVDLENAKSGGTETGSTSGHPRKEMIQWEISGSVANRAGQPIEGARVVWVRPEEEHLPWLTSPTAKARVVRSDKSGKFTLVLDEDDVFVVVRHPSYRTYVKRIGRTSRVEKLSIVLEDGATIRGRVVCEKVGPMQGVSVIAIGGGTKLPHTTELDDVLWGVHSAEQQARTDKSGAFVISGLRNEEYRIEAITPGMLQDGAAEQIKVARPGDDVEIVVSPAACLALELVDSHTGAPLGAGWGSTRISPTDPNWGVEPLWLSTVWVGAADLRGVSGYRQIWLFHPRAWPVDLSVAANVTVEIPGYQPSATRVPLQLPMRDGPFKVARIALERERDSGLVNAHFCDADGKPLSGPLYFKFPLAGDDGHWVFNRYVLVSSDNEDAHMSWVFPGGATYDEYLRSEYTEKGRSRLWSCNPVFVVPGSKVEWYVRLRGSFLRLRAQIAEGEGQQSQPILDAAGIAYVMGPGPIKPTNLAPGEREGVRVSLSYFQASDGVWVIGPLEPGMYTFRVDAPGFSKEFSTVLDAGRIEDRVVNLGGVK